MLCGFACSGAGESRLEQEDGTEDVVAVVGGIVEQSQQDCETIHSERATCAGKDTTSLTDTVGASGTVAPDRVVPEDGAPSHCDVAVDPVVDPASLAIATRSTITADGTIGEECGRSNVDRIT